MAAPRVCCWLCPTCASVCSSCARLCSSLPPVPSCRFQPCSPSKAPTSSDHRGSRGPPPPPSSSHGRRCGSCCCWPPTTLRQRNSALAKALRWLLWCQWAMARPSSPGTSTGLSTASSSAMDPPARRSDRLSSGNCTGPSSCPQNSAARGESRDARTVHASRRCWAASTESTITDATVVSSARGTRAAALCRRGVARWPPIVLCLDDDSPFSQRPRGAAAADGAVAMHAC